MSADYVKTSSGFGFVKQQNGDYNYVGATIENLNLMKASIGPKVKGKAAFLATQILKIYRKEVELFLKKC